MGATYTRQSSSAIVDGGVIEASDINAEFDQVLAAFAVTSGHTHDGTAAEGGPITKLLGTAITIGDATAGTDIAVTFDGETADGVLTWMEDEDYFKFSDEVLMNSTEKLLFGDTGTYIHQSADGVLDLVSDTEIEINATTIDINGAVAMDGAITGATNITLSGELDAATLDISGNADIDGTLEADAITINGTAIASVLSPIAGGSGIVTTGALDAGSITSGFGAIDNGTSGIRTNTFTAETSFVPDAQDGAALGTTSLQFSDLFLADEAVIGFGDNNEVTLTHVHDTGILLNGTNVIQFNDASQNIGAPSNAILDINATDEIELNSTLIDINANVEISGTATTTGVHTFTAVPLFPNNTIETADIQADAITAAKIADNAVVTAGINADAVTAAKIADNAVVTAGINADAVTGAEIADDAINSEHYTDGSIDHVHLAGDAVDGDNLADNAVDSEHYTDGSIDTVHIGDNQVTLAKMAGGTDGNIISFDASGDPVAIATGSDGQVLTSTGAGSPPAFETPAAGISAGKAIAFAIVFG